jgi:hypothetical protein
VHAAPVTRDGPVAIGGLWIDGANLDHPLLNAHLF